ncbi:hypothetical protein GCM10009826_36980 [Humibacillus xanthopallidus]
MNELIEWFQDTPKLGLVPIAMLLLGVAGYRLTRRNSATSNKSLEISQAQEERRKATLSIRLISATCEVSDRERRYIFDLLIRNPSDRGNALAEADLCFEYAVDGRPVNLKAPWRPNESSPPPGALTLPFTIPANSAAAGSLQITTKRGLTDDRDVEELKLVLTDTFGNDITLPSQFVHEQLKKADEDGS